MGKIDLGGGHWMEDPADKTVPPDYTFSIPCAWCGKPIELERDPADWPNVPDGVGVVVECNACGAKTRTEGKAPVEHVQELTSAIEAEVREEVARRLSAADSGGAEAEAAGSR